MKKNSAVLGVAVVATTLVLCPAMAAHATPWDGNTIQVGSVEFEFSSGPFGMQDAYLVPLNGGQQSDVWDYASLLTVSFNNWSSFEGAITGSNSAVDVVTLPNGDTTLTATMTNAEFASNNLTVVGEFRIYSEGDLVRAAYRLTNTGTSATTVDLGFFTDWGNSEDVVNGGGIRGYQNQSDSVLAVPAEEDSTSMAALNSANVRWFTHGVRPAAPGGIAWGMPTGAANPAVLSSLSGGEVEVHIDDVTIPAGDTVTVVEFHNWAPAAMIDDGWTWSGSNTNIAYSDLITANSTEFDSFSGRLTEGLENDSVINWGPVSSTDSGAEELASTGMNDIAAQSGFVAVGILFAMGAMLRIRMRRHRN